MTKDSGGLRRLSKLDKAGAGVSLRCDLEQRYSVAREFQGDFCRDYTYFIIFPFYLHIAFPWAFSVARNAWRMLGSHCRLALHRGADLGDVSDSLSCHLWPEPVTSALVCLMKWFPIPYHCKLAIYVANSIKFQLYSHCTSKGVIQWSYTSHTYILFFSPSLRCCRPNVSSRRETWGNGYCCWAGRKLHCSGRDHWLQHLRYIWLGCRCLRLPLKTQWHWCKSAAVFKSSKIMQDELCSAICAVCFSWGWQMQWLYFLQAPTLSNPQPFDVGY